MQYVVFEPRLHGASVHHGRRHGAHRQRFAHRVEDARDDLPGVEFVVESAHRFVVRKDLGADDADATDVGVSERGLQRAEPEDGVQRGFDEPRHVVGAAALGEGRGFVADAFDDLLAIRGLGESMGLGLEGFGQGVDVCVLALLGGPIRESVLAATGAGTLISGSQGRVYSPRSMTWPLGK